MDDDHGSSVGMHTRALLAKPVATRETPAREEVAHKWAELLEIERRYLTEAAVDNCMRLLSHFAPPTSNAPILRMSVEDIAKEMTAAIRDRMDFAERGNIDIGALARVAHRLAQPVPEVDVDAGAKEALWRFWCAVPGRNPYASKEAAWREATNEDKSRWINFAAAEKGDG